MNWIHLNRAVHRYAWLLLAAIISAGGIYLSGFPWNCQQALRARNLATLRLKRAQADYPPGAVYRNYREVGWREANNTVSTKCANQPNETSSAHQKTKFFLKYRSDY